MGEGLIMGKIDLSVPDFTSEELRSLIVKAEDGDKLSEQLLLPLMERYWAPKIIDLLEEMPIEEIHKMIEEKNYHL